MLALFIIFTSAWVAYNTAIYFRYGLLNSVTEIGRLEFINCAGLNGGLTLPSAMDVVKYGCFSSLTSINGALVIPSSVYSIESYGFENMPNVVKINNYRLNPQTITSDSFSRFPKTIPLHVPIGAKLSYQSAQYWNEFTNIIDDL